MHCSPHTLPGYNLHSTHTPPKPTTQVGINALLAVNDVIVITTRTWVPAATPTKWQQCQGCNQYNAQDIGRWKAEKPLEQPQPLMFCKQPVVEISKVRIWTVESTGGKQSGG